jgi:ElaB/YqjD/DUF883 family membrane-anchored ribosome-binding protein
LLFEAPLRTGVPMSTFAIPNTPSTEAQSPSAQAQAAVDAASAALSHAAVNLQQFEGRVRNFVVEKPAVAVVGAVAAGFIFGRILSRL